MDPVANFAISVVATAPSPATSGTSLVLATGTGATFPVTGSFNVTVWPAGALPSATNAEICRCTRSGDTLTLTRIQEGSTARAIVVADQVAQTVTAGLLAQLDLRMFNVRAYGAVGNGTTDDNAAIVAADAAAATSMGVVYYPPGTYRTSHPIAPSAGVTHAGAGMHTSIVTVLPADFANFVYSYIFTCGNANVTIRDLGLDGQKRNGANPANQCGGITPGPSTMLLRVRVDDPNYFGMFVGSSTTQARVIDCRSARGGNNDCIGGGGATDLQIVRHIWESTLVGNRFDNVGGTDVVLDSCLNLSTNTGNIYFEAMVSSGIRNSYVPTLDISLQSDGGYSPPTPTSPLKCFAIRNVCASVLVNYAATGNKGGYNVVSENVIDSASVYGVLLSGAGILPAMQLGGDHVHDNIIRNCNATNVSSFNGGSGTADPSAINLLNSYASIIENNVCTDDRATHQMNYAVMLGGASGAQAHNCIIRNNTCSGSLGGSLGVADIVTQTDVTGCQIIGNATPGGVYTNWQHTFLVRGNVGFIAGHDLAGQSQPTVPATTVAYTNALSFDCTVHVTAGAAVTTVAIGGTTALVLAASAQGTVRVPVGQTITLTYASGTPTWAWFGD